MPDSALAKLSEAQVAISKLMKAMTSAIGNLKDVLGSDLAKKSYGELAEDLKALRATDNNVENIRVFGEMDDGSVASCSSVLKILSKTATLMEKSWKDLQAGQGLLSGLKKHG